MRLQVRYPRGPPRRGRFPRACAARSLQPALSPPRAHPGPGAGPAGAAAPLSPPRAPHKVLLRAGGPAGASCLTDTGPRVAAAGRPPRCVPGGSGRRRGGWLGTAGGYGRCASASRRGGKRALWESWGAEATPAAWAPCWQTFGASRAGAGGRGRRRRPVSGVWRKEQAGRERGARDRAAGLWEHASCW